VFDLYAGSGALGIEAISRGAAAVVFVESDRVAARVIEQNVGALALAPVATVVVADALRWIEERTTTARPPDLVLVDPPYAVGSWDRLLSALARYPDVTVVAEAADPVEAAGWDVLNVKRHGGTVVSLLRPRGANTP